VPQLGGMCVTQAMDLVVQAPDIATPTLKELAKLAQASGITAIAGAGQQAFRLSGARNRTGVAEFCGAAALDFGFVPPTQQRSRVRLVAMDMDSTLIAIECIDEIADLRGIKPEIAAITASAMRGEIDFRESLTRRVGLLAGLDAAALGRVYAERLQLSPGAERMLAGFSSAGARTLLVSGGFSYFTDRLKTRLGFDYALANSLEIVGDKLTGRIAGPIVDAQVKADTMRQIAGEIGAVGDLVVAIGDGANDLPMLAEADVGIAYHAKPIVRERANYAIDYCGLDAILNLFI
jgi:phosphoserine phosphatase